MCVCVCVCKRGGGLKANAMESACQAAAASLPESVAATALGPIAAACKLSALLL